MIFIPLLGLMLCSDFQSFEPISTTESPSHLRRSLFTSTLFPGKRPTLSVLVSWALANKCLNCADDTRSDLVAGDDGLGG